jgi:hypothetical protein
MESCYSVIHHNTDIYKIEETGETFNNIKSNTREAYEEYTFLKSVNGLTSELDIFYLLFVSINMFETLQMLCYLCVAKSSGDKEVIMGLSEQIFA